MSFSSKFQIVFQILSMLAILKGADCDIFSECENVPNNSFTASSKSCSGYIYCNGDESFEGQCDDASYFNDEEKVCDDKDLVDCHLEDDDDKTTPTTTASATTITTTTSSSTVANSTVSATAPLENTTNANNSTLLSTTTVASTLSTTTATAIATTTASTIIIFHECPAVDNPFQLVFLASTKSCSEYFVCIHGTPIEMFCSGMLHFNAITGKCDYPENVKCVPDYSKPKEQCRRNIVDLFPHTSNCNYYYMCQNGFLMLQQCPLFFGWDIERRNCVTMNIAKCYAK